MNVLAGEDMTPVETPRALMRTVVGAEETPSLLFLFLPLLRQRANVINPVLGHDANWLSVSNTISAFYFFIIPTIKCDSFVLT
jgi:hypothetical protein